MQRRTFLRLLGVGTVGLAGCGSSDGEAPPSPGGGTETSTASIPVYPFNAGSATEFEFAESENGTAIIHVPVENTKPEPYTGTLSLTVVVDGEKRTLSRSIQLAGNESTKFPIEVDANWSTWNPNFQNVRFSQGTPVGDED